MSLLCRWTSGFVQFLDKVVDIPVVSTTVLLLTAIEGSCTNSVSEFVDINTLSEGSRRKQQKVSAREFPFFFCVTFVKLHVGGLKELHTRRVPRGGEESDASVLT